MTLTPGQEGPLAQSLEHTLFVMGPESIQVSFQYSTTCLFYFLEEGFLLANLDMQIILENTRC